MSNSLGMFTPSPFRQMLLLLAVIVVAMYMQQNSVLSSDHKYELYYPLDEAGTTDNFHAYQAITNESKHLYPYLAAVISIVCLVGTILGIICLAPE
jgi:hypothetical protein